MENCNHDFCHDHGNEEEPVPLIGAGVIKANSNFLYEIPESHKVFSNKVSKMFKDLQSKIYQSEDNHIETSYRESFLSRLKNLMILLRELDVNNIIYYAVEHEAFYATPIDKIIYYGDKQLVINNFVPVGPCNDKDCTKCSYFFADIECS